MAEQVLLRCVALNIHLWLPVWPDDSTVTFPAWTTSTLDRPGRNQLAIPTYRTTEERTLGFTLRHEDYRQSVQPMLDDLRQIAKTKAAFQLLMGKMNTGLWRMDPPQITELGRDDDGYPSIVDVSLTLKAASDAQINVGPVPRVRGRVSRASKKG